jgi:hypothetical protein
MAPGHRPLHGRCGRTHPSRKAPGANGIRIRRRRAGQGGDVSLYYDGELVGEGRVERTQPMIYSADEACDVGADSGSPASPDYGATGNKFSGQIHWVQIDIGDDSQDHLIKAEDRLTIAMARQ